MLGAMRDDCPNEAGDSTRDLQGCLDSNGDGWSNQYGGFKAAIAIMGEDLAASWLTYLIIGLGFTFGAMIALIVKMGRGEDLTEDDLLMVSNRLTLNLICIVKAQEMIPISENQPITGNETLVVNEQASDTAQGGVGNANQPYKALSLTLLMFMSVLSMTLISSPVAVEETEEDPLVEAGLSLVALRNDTLDTNQDGEFDAIRVVAVFATELESVNLELRLIGEHKGREVSEVLQFSFSGQSNVSLFTMHGRLVNTN